MCKFKKILATILLASVSIISADDIDILNSAKPSTANILFVMDLSGSMEWGQVNESVPSDTDPARIDILSGAFQDLINNPAFENINIGLSVFSGGAQDNKGASLAHGITYPISPLLDDAQSSLSRTGFTHPGTVPNNSYMPSAGTNNSRDYLGLLSSNSSIWKPGGSTPIVDALYEAARYFRGENTEFGSFAPSNIRSAHPSSYIGNPIKKIADARLSCDASERISCVAGSCGPAESCTSTTSIQASLTDTGGCDFVSGGRTSCSVPTAGLPPQTCDTGNNCTLNNNTQAVNCGTLSVDRCILENPTYYACSTSEVDVPVVNSEGQITLGTENRTTCSVDISYYSCDAAPYYNCPIVIEACTYCSEVETGDRDAQYRTPITDACVSNSIILLSDGEPTKNTSAGLIKDILSESQANNCDAATGTNDIVEYGRCGTELAGFLANEDQNTNLEGAQTVVTHTVGLALDASSASAQYLSDLALAGKGSFLSAGSEAELVAAFELLVSETIPKARSFSSPSYSVDTSNLLSHGNSIYVPMFDRRGVVWPGNLKKFQIINGVISDLTGNPATNSDGEILSTAKDMWSDPLVPGTDPITSGGAANKINPEGRVVKTNNGTSLIDLSDNLANSEFGLDSTAANNAVKSELINYIKGAKLDGTPRYHMGDIIHSKPVQLIRSNTAGVDSKTIFVGTNEGFLHAIDDKDGSEIFAFMPNELLPNIKKQYDNDFMGSHVYGVDGPITLWLDERGSDTQHYGNGKLDPGEEAYLFFGLRRGGKSYYALNVTDPANPTLMWKKQFGAAGKVADSWSQPVVAMLKTDLATSSNDPVPVLVIGGGYSEDANGNEIPSQGNAVYIVDAISSSTGGNVIWTTPTTSALASKGTISNSIPSRIRVIDTDRNGSIDRLYFGDTGGNIWRVDLSASYYDTNPSNDGDLSKATLYKIAQLGSTGSDSENRKFFEEPDVSIFKLAGNFIATIAIGSGDRTKPLDSSVDDRFFVLYDREVFVKPTQSTITMNPTSGGLTKSSDVVLSGLKVPSFRGWHKDLTSITGEKVLSGAITYNNKVAFTTFGTTGITGQNDVCSAHNTNESRLYIMDLLLAVNNINEVVATGEILGTPQLYIGELKNNSNTICNVEDGDQDCLREVNFKVGKATTFAIPAQESGIDIPEALPRVYWFDNEEQ